MSEQTLHNCLYCGRDYKLEEGFDRQYCSEACWETATDYGEETE